MSADLVDCPYLSAYCRPNEEADLERADKTESLGQKWRERRLIGHQLNVAAQDGAFALW